MANQIYANMMEVSCKAAQGKSACAFPDVCMTPPQTPATPPGVPIPYPNTGLSSDCSGGTTTVKISGQEAMLKNKSYFKKSSGDEAGCAPKKGIITSKNMGKVYFNMWSMDVKFEGENVVRHLDMTTHNHASMPGNGPPWPYLDEMAFAGSGPCGNTAKNVKEKCDKHVQKTKKGDVKRKPTMDAMCADNDCKEARKCVLSPYSPSNCCDGKTGHHVLPVHCFMPPGERAKGGANVYGGCEGYEMNKAPCVCVTGHDKSTGEHKLAHDTFDKLEDDHMVDGKAGSWTYAQAREAGGKSVKDATGCDEECTKSQLDSYHKKEAGKPALKDDTALRADSTGQRTPENFSPQTEGVGGL